MLFIDYKQKKYSRKSSFATVVKFINMIDFALSSSYWI